MMVLLDTSAIYALADQDDPDHARAIVLMEQAIASRERILTHNYVVTEAISVLQRRLGVDPALKFLDEVRAFPVHWVTLEDHEQALGLFRRRARRRLSIVDCVSFIVMRHYGITTAFAFDGDFIREGFTLYGDA